MRLLPILPLLALCGAISAADPALLEAELADLVGPVEKTDHFGYTGTGFADYGRTIGETITWTHTADTAGAHQLVFRYGNGSSARPLRLLINDVEVAILDFGNSGGWSKWTTETISVPLENGPNTIQLVSTITNGPNLDSLSITAPVGGTNEAPVIALPASLVVDSDQFVIDASVSDPEGDQLTYTWSVTSGTSVLVSGADAEDVTAQVATNGAATYTLTASDGTSQTTASVDVTVAAATVDIFGSVADNDAAPSPANPVGLYWIPSGSIVATTTTDAAGAWSFDIIGTLSDYRVVIYGQ